MCGIIQRTSITPANNRLSGREGLDGMIHQKAGKELTQVSRNICLEMRKINTPPCAVTQNVVTEPFALSDSTHIIHAVDPTADDPIKTRLDGLLLSETYANLFTTIQEVGGVSSVVSPPISMGVCLPHREGTPDPQVLLEMMDGEKDYGIRNYTIVVKEKNSSATCGPSTEKAKISFLAWTRPCRTQFASADRCGRVARSVERSLPRP